MIIDNNTFEVFFIRSLPPEFLEITINSFISSIPENLRSINYKIVDEKTQRESTLNYILSLRAKNKDAFIIADDIIFKPGWFESLCKNYKKAHIFGFSMLNSENSKIQDFGYDFIEIDGGLTCRGLYKDDEIGSIKIPEFRYCDSVCGCAMFIKSQVFDLVSSFSLDGQNRAGELIFTNQAKENNFKVAVLGSHLNHGGISTKQNKNIALSSLSWIYERDIWDLIVKKHFKNVRPKESFYQILSLSLIETLKSSKTTLIYGCGTIADFILKQKILANFDVCSGLNEEINQFFHKKKILNANLLDFRKYDNILITPIGYESTIFKLYFEKESAEIKEKIIKIKRNYHEDKISFELK